MTLPQNTFDFVRKVDAVGGVKPEWMLRYMGGCNKDMNQHTIDSLTAATWWATRVQASLFEVEDVLFGARGWTWWAAGHAPSRPQADGLGSACRWTPAARTWRSELSYDC
eukprot:SAG31_NODE_985_length_10549_cov_2.605339_8_plen_110_part_00